MTTDLEYDYVNQEPVLVPAGTTWKWDRSYSDFKSDTYTLTYYFRESAGKSSFNIVAAANDNNFRITVPKATTKEYMAGIYTGQGFVESATERYQVYDGSIEIQQDYSLVSDGQDLRTHNEKVLEQIKLLTLDFSEKELRKLLSNKEFDLGYLKKIFSKNSKTK